jgi:hypothetical protein
MHTTVLENASLLACRNCFEIISDNLTDTKPKTARIPDDWTFVQIGTQGEYNKHKFRIVGRMRMQLRNEYKNFWSAEYSNGKCFWIVESFASFSIFSPTWEKYIEDRSNLRSGLKIKLEGDLKLLGEYVEKCEGVSYQGELGPWKLFYPGFFLIQASAGSKTSLFFINSSDPIEYISGEKTTPERLSLTNTITWNEWK